MAAAAGAVRHHRRHPRLQPEAPRLRHDQDLPLLLGCVFGQLLECHIVECAAAFCKYTVLFASLTTKTFCFFSGARTIQARTTV